MQYNEVINRLQKLINYTPTQSQLCEITNVKQSTMSQRAKENSAFKLEEINKINKYYKINLFTNSSENITNKTEVDVTNTVTAYIYPEVFGSCGNGVFELSQERYPIQIQKEYFFKEISPIKTYSVINAYGESMQPTIKDGDKLIVEHLETGEQMQDNRIYVFCYDNRISVKRLIYNVDEIVIKSDNPDKETYKTKYIQKDDINNMLIIGQIVGLARDLR